MQRIVLILISLFYLSLSSYGQKFKEIFIHIDSSNFGKYNEFYYDITLIKKKGKQILIDKYSSRNDWKNLQIKSTNLFTDSRGICKFDLDKISKENQICTITVRELKSNLEKTISFNLPYISGLEIKSNTLIANRKVDVEYNVIFSNGYVNRLNNGILNWGNIKIVCPNAQIDFSKNSLLLHLDRPHFKPSLFLQFYHQNTNQLLCTKEMNIEYPNFASFDFTGNDGNDGRNGSNGSYPSGNGSSGTDGGSGASGSPMKLFVFYQGMNNQNFLIIDGFASGSRRLHEVLKYETSSVKIDAYGGNGGIGGNGGNGAIGKIDTANRVNSPRGGNGGNAGNGGNGGNGGDIEVYFHEEVYFLAERFQINNRAGRSGTAGSFGTAGKGDYSNSKLIGTVLSLKDGSPGKPAQNGQDGIDGKEEIIKVELADFDKLLQQHIERGQ